MNDLALRVALQAQVARVRRRVERVPGSNPDDVREVLAAAERVLDLRPRLGLGAFKGNLVPRGAKPRFLLVFDLPPHGDVVLKVYGRGRAGEVHLQRLWADNGVATVGILAAETDSTTWLLMRRLHLMPLTRQPRTPEVLAALTDELAGLVRRAHETAATGSNTLRDACRGSGPAVHQHLSSVGRCLSAHGYSAPDVGDLLLHVHEHKPRPIHGDLAAGNVVRDARGGELRLLDASAYLGPQEFDAARWAARMGGVEQGEALLYRWLVIENGLDPAKALLLLGLEFLMEAGVREVRAEEERRPQVIPDVRTTALLAQADQLVRRYGSMA